MRLEYCYKEQPITVLADGTFSAMELRVLVHGADDEEAALMYALDKVPSFRRGLTLDRVEIVERKGDIYELAAYYNSASFGASGSEKSEATFSFDCSGGTVRVTRAIAQRHPYGVRDAGLLIGWNGKGGEDMQVAGVEVPTGNMRETYEKVMSKSQLSTAYRRRLARLVGTVNDDKFKGWERGEVMFLGASFSSGDKSGSKVRVSFNFLIRENENNMKLDQINVGLVHGHDYVWQISGARRSDGNISAAISDVYVSQVAPYRDFRLLGI